MKQYWEISGPSKAPHEPCIAFYKYDGSNIRAEWTKKRGWHKFGSRKVLIDRSSELGREAINTFLSTYSEDLAKVFTDNKLFRNCQNVTVFCEFFGENSFAGQHNPNDEKEIVLLDVNIHKKGIMLPRDFVKTFGHLKIPEVIYEGIFNLTFIHDVINGRYPVEEGIVAKGILPNKKSQHSLWMAKVKTAKWINKLKNRAQTDVRFKKELEDNLREQK